MATKRQPESYVVEACLNLLELFGFPARRQNTGAAMTEYAGRRRLVRFGSPGASDITGIVPKSGRRLDIECKHDPAGVQALLRGSNARHAAQLHVLETTSQFGGVGIVVCSVSDLEQVLYTLRRNPQAVIHIDASKHG